MCGNNFHSVANNFQPLRHSVFNEMLLIWGIFIFSKEQMSMSFFKRAKQHVIN